ncbi:hypothetical protein YC2023_107027 [Brassica napus]
MTQYDLSLVVKGSVTLIVKGDGFDEDRIKKKLDKIQKEADGGGHYSVPGNEYLCRNQLTVRRRKKISPVSLKFSGIDDLYVFVSVFKTRPEVEPNNFWIMVQYGSTVSNLV